jgi:hypothetical protein
MSYNYKAINFSLAEGNLSFLRIEYTLTWDILNEHQQVLRQLLRCMQNLCCCPDYHFSSMELTALKLAFGAVNTKQLWIVRLVTWE